MSKGGRAVPSSRRMGTEDTVRSPPRLGRIQHPFYDVTPIAAAMRLAPPSCRLPRFSPRRRPLSRHRNPMRRRQCRSPRRKTSEGRPSAPPARSRAGPLRLQARIRQARGAAALDHPQPHGTLPTVSPTPQRQPPTAPWLTLECPLRYQGQLGSIDG